MLTSARITEELRPAHLDWLSALRADQIKALVAAEALQLSLFDEQNLVAITHPDFPGERLIACHNPFLEAERARKRESLLAAAEADLGKIAAACRARPATTAARHGQDRRAGQQGPQPAQGRQALHRQRRRGVAISAPAGSRTPSLRRQDSTASTCCAPALIPGQGPGQTARSYSSYKALAQVERAFRAFNTDLDIRPIQHAPRPTGPGARVLADAVVLHQLAHGAGPARAPLLFTDDDKPAAAAKRADPVAAAQRSDQALTKAARKRTQDGVAVHSFTSLLADLATICANHIQPADDTPAFTMITSPTPLQRQAFDLLGLSHRHGYA